MKSFIRLANTPPAVPLAADDITELHAARLLLLFRVCGSSNKITGLTKMAKLDFFVRYPSFFKRIVDYLGADDEVVEGEGESAMVRHHYGPWDKRYYQVLAFLEARDLITVEKKGKAYIFELTGMGLSKAKVLAKTGPFLGMVDQMKLVKKVLGGKSGSQLKNLVYEVFDEEVSKRKLGEIIK